LKEIGTIKIQKRDAEGTRANGRIRREGDLPSNICSKGKDSVAVSVKREELKRAILKYGRNSVYKLDLPDDKSYTAVIKNIQSSPMDFNKWIHVEFHEISLTEEIRVDVPVVLIGKESFETKAVLLNKHIETISVRGLPQNIPDRIEVDVLNMKLGDSIFVRDIKLPEGLTTDTDPDKNVVNVSELKKVEAPAEDVKPEVNTADAAKTGA
jgi:large subunit ribosomal protein L25